MSALLLVARLVLGAVFAAAAVGKLTDRAGSRLAVERFGAPAAAAGFLGVALPVAELAIALGLIVTLSAAWAAVGAVLLLVVFCAAIARSLARGDAADCHCFGSVGSAPVGWATLARNAGLIALAGLVAIAGRNDPGAGVASAASELGAVAIVLGVAIVLQMAFSWQLFRQNGRLLRRVSDLEGTLDRGADQEEPAAQLAIGEPAPSFALPDLDGRRVSLEELLAPGRGLVLVFTDPACGHCDPLLPALGGAGRERATPVVVVSRGSHAENAARAQEHGIAPLLLQEDFEVAEAYRVFGFPAAITIDSAGRIDGARAGGATAVAELLAATATPAPLPPIRLAAAGGIVAEIGR